MKIETLATLTSLDLCTLIAHETVSLLNTDADTVETATQLRTGLEVFAAAEGLTDGVGDLLEWVDQELESAKQFATTEEDTPHLIDPDSLLPVPDAAIQMELVWALFQVAVNQPYEQRQMLLTTARTVTDMGGLEDMLLTAKVSAKNILTAEDLQSELENVHTAIATQSLIE